MGVVGSWVATWCWSIASRRLPLSLSAQLIVAETVFGLLYGFVYEYRRPALAEWIGILLQLVGAGVAVAVFTGPHRLQRRTAVTAEPARSARSMERNMLSFGIDTVTLSGTLEAKLRAIKASGLRVMGFQVLRDFEGLPPALRSYKLDVANVMLEMAHAIGAPLLLVCSSTSPHTSQNLDTIAEDLERLAAQARPLGLKVAYEALSWGRVVHEFTTAWEVVRRAAAPNLGLVVDSFHAFATRTPLAQLDRLDVNRIFLVQLADFLWPELLTPEERMTTARHFRVFPGEGAHNTQMKELVERLDALGYAGDYSFEVFNDDYQQMPQPSEGFGHFPLAVDLEAPLRRAVRVGVDDGVVVDQLARMLRQTAPLCVFRAAHCHLAHRLEVTRDQCRLLQVADADREVGTVREWIAWPVAQVEHDLRPRIAQHQFAYRAVEVHHPEGRG